MLNKNNISPNEEIPVIITCIVNGGVDTGLHGSVSGELIAKLEDVLDEIAIYISKDKSTQINI